MLRLLSCLGLAALGSAASGCAYYTATSSVQGRAFIVKANYFGGSTFWNCDATNGDPVCYQTTKVPLATPAVAK